MSDKSAIENKIIIPEKEIPITMEADVIVVGGGPSGFGVALLAARKGTARKLERSQGSRPVCRSRIK